MDTSKDVEYEVNRDEEYIFDSAKQSITIKYTTSNGEKQSVERSQVCYRVGMLV